MNVKNSNCYQEDRHCMCSLSFYAKYTVCTVEKWGGKGRMKPSAWKTV